MKDCPVNVPKSHERGFTCMFVGCDNPTSSGDCAILVNPTNKFYKYKSWGVAFLKRQYCAQDPNVSCNSCVLTIEGPDPAFLNQGSDTDNGTQNFDLNVLDDDDDQTI